MVLASVGLRLFGPHTRSAVLAMLLLMGISALAFLMRYRDAHASIVVGMFHIAHTDGVHAAGVERILLDPNPNWRHSLFFAAPCPTPVQICCCVAWSSLVLR